MHTDKKPTLSVVIPALNEEGNLRDTVTAVCQAMGQKFDAYEIIIFDDSSTDRTGQIAEELANEDNNIKVIHNPRTMGFGYNIHAGIEQARYEYVTMVPGDNEIPVQSIEKMFNAVGPADIVITYFTNQEIRATHRRLISRLYTTILNFAFGLNLKYYNGPCVYRREVIQRTPRSTNGFAYLSSTLIRMLKQGHDYVEVGVELGQRHSGSSKALSLLNVILVAKTILLLAFETNVRRSPSQQKRTK